MRSKASRRSATLAQRLLPIAFVSASLFWSFVASPLSPEASAAALTSQQVGQFIDPSPTPWPGDAFGQSVSVSSDGFLAVIGAPGATGVDGTASEGLVYVYGQEDGAWTEIAELAPSDASPDTNFGQTVSISSDGSVVLVGEASAGTPGEAYIFVEPSNGWSGVVNESAILVGGDSTIHSDFGVSAAITPDGTEAVIGAQYQGGTTSGQGEAYVFTEPAGGWNGSVSPTELLLPNPSDVVPNFGGMGNSISVSSDGSTVAVGFSWAYGAGGAGCGDVYIYVAPEGGWGGSMTPTSTLIAPTGQSGGHFGLSLSMTSDGSSLAIGGDYAVFIFSDVAGNWIQTDYISDPDSSLHEGFGDSLAIASDGSGLLVGAPDTTVDGIGEVGESFYFTNSDGSFNLVSQLEPSSPFFGESLGWDVAFFNNDESALVGAPAFLVETSAAPSSSSLETARAARVSMESQASGTAPHSSEALMSSSGSSNPTALEFSLTKLSTSLYFTSSSQATFVQGVDNSFTVTCSGSPTPTITEAGPLPTGVAFIDNGTGTATISGTPVNGAEGSYSITITASDGTAPDAVQNFTLLVGQSPAITSSNAVAFVVGKAGTFSPTATGSPPPSLTISGLLPKGVDFVSGVFSGTPAASTAGTYPITLTASNGISPDATQSFTLTVLPVGITTTSLPSGSVYSKSNKVLYSATLAAAGGNPPYKWSLASGSLPPGLKLSSKGVISGKAMTGGTYSFTVQVVDTKTKTKPPTQNTATAMLSITIG